MLLNLDLNSDFNCSIFDISADRIGAMVMVENGLN